MRRFVRLQYFGIASLGLVLSASMHAAPRVCGRDADARPVATIRELRCFAEITDARSLSPRFAPSPEPAKVASEEKDSDKARRDDAEPLLSPEPEQISRSLPSGFKVNQRVMVLAGPRSTGAMGDAQARVSPEQMMNMAGTLGDPMRYFQVLPGVLSDSDQRNDFLVRGGNPSETLFVVDGIEVPSVNQLALSDTTGGLLSMIDSEAIESMTMHSGVHDALFDDRLSAVVEISTVGEPNSALGAGLARRGTRRIAEAGFEGVGGMISWQTPDQGSLLLSARRSVLNLMTNDIGMNGVPVYTNSLLRGDQTLGDRDRVWGMSLTGVDSIAIRPSANDGQETNPFNVDYDGWRNTTGVNWQHGFSSKTFGILTAQNSEQSQAIVEYDQQLSDAPTYTENTLDGSTTVKYEATSQMRPWLLASGGATGTQQRVNYGITQPVPLPSPYSVSPVSANATAVQANFSSPLLGGFVQGTVLMPGGVRVTLGTRLTHWGFDGATQWTPRALLAVPLGGTRAVALGYAEYSQLSSFLYLLAFPENHAMVPIRAQHLTVDVKDVVKTRRFSLGLGAYEKRYMNYPVAANYPQLSMANIADTFGESFLMFPMVSQGRGRTAGIESSLEWQPSDRFRMQGSVTYSRAWYSGLDGVMRRGNFDIPLAANVAAMWTMHRGLMLSMRYEGTSGRVYTPDDMSQSMAQNRDVYDLTMINRDRSAPYGRLDFRFEQTHPLRGGMLTWHLGLLNALNQKNFYALLWQPNEPKGYQGQQQQNQMPRFPDGGVNYVF